jgi:hypothetical protein
VLGNPAPIAQAVRDELNRRINDDVQAAAVGTSGLPPTAPVVTPGQAVNRLGALLDTPACNGAPNPQTCDDRVSGNQVVAGANGIAETVAVNRVTDLTPGISSAWRNPERNEAVCGVLNSRHQYGDAIDLELTADHVAAAGGKTMAQLYCLLETAADAVAASIGGDALAELGSAPRNCDATVNHVHIERN